jgi:Fatty acid desaturase
MDTIESLQTFVGENLSLLAPVDQAWQPTDYLPDLTGDDWAAQIARFRDSARLVSDELLVVLVGNMVTEEALPNYAISLEHIAHDKAQDYLCRQPERYERLAGEIADRLAKRPTPHFSWIHGRKA